MKKLFENFVEASNLSNNGGCDNPSSKLFLKDLVFAFLYIFERRVAFQHRLSLK